MSATWTGVCSGVPSDAAIGCWILMLLRGQSQNLVPSQQLPIMPRVIVQCEQSCRVPPLPAGQSDFFVWNKALDKYFLWNHSFLDRCLKFVNFADSATTLSTFDYRWQ